MELLFRILASALLCIAPTVLFLGFWDGLKRMQKGQLVEGVAGQHGVSVDHLLSVMQPHPKFVFGSADQRALIRITADDTSDDGHTLWDKHKQE